MGLPQGSDAEVVGALPGFQRSAGALRLQPHVLVWGGSPRLSACRGISSSTAAQFPWTHRFHPFGRPLSKGLFKVKLKARIFKFVAIHLLSEEGSFLAVVL